MPVTMPGGRPALSSTKSGPLARHHSLTLSSSMRSKRSATSSPPDSHLVGGGGGGGTELRRGQSDPYPGTALRRRVTSHEPVETPPSLDEDIVYIDSTPPILEHTESTTPAAEYRLLLPRRESSQTVAKSHRQIINQEVDGIRINLVQTALK